MTSTPIMLPLVVAALSTWLAFDTTRRVSRYGAAGMTAGMAAMMAAMGTGLSVGYAAGMLWDLGWANLAGVLAGFAHGLWMGRRYGPMSALDGAGGGVMGGLMGPMLSVMLIALPLGLIWTAGLMLLLQWAFSVGAVYLVAAGAARAPQGGLMGAVGWLLGAHLVSPEAVEEPCEPSPAPSLALRPARAATRSSSRPRHPAPVQGAVRRSFAGPVLAVIGLFAVGAAYAAQRVTEGATPTDGGDSKPVVAPVGPDGAQHVSITLKAPYYSPAVTEVKRGVPVRVTLNAVGEPG